ncbi:MAG TPA: hypothetical protein VG537_00950 [Candidatus Kapabacteria bacterium]|jgi:hypothetical protein|nr:hypothetical protein [Candidatus Kapabacteria bacterium]
MRKSLFVFVLMCGSSAAIAQTTNTYPWPVSGPIGLGTALSSPSTVQNALQIHYDTLHDSWPAILRLSEGSGTNSPIFGALALMPWPVTGFLNANYSNLAKTNDLVLHQNDGDLILADFQDQGAAIRFSTSPDPSTLLGLSPAPPANDLERMEILGNGNVGIDLPPDATTMLGKPLDQVQIGGGVTSYPGNSCPTPGLTIYGGNRFENMMRAGHGGLEPSDRRYISFNHYIDHTDSSSARFHRFQPLSSSEIDFSSDNGGLLSFNTEPYDVTRGLNSFARKMVLELSGTYGMGMWVWDSAATVQKHTLWEVNPPGIKLGSITRNTNGIFVHHTPVLITSDTASYPSIDFENLRVHPNIGDDTTWDLVVNGPALFKEAYVNLYDWPDTVFMPSYKAMSIDDFGNYVMKEHHLPDLPSAKEMGAGLPLGKTEANLTKQVEEMALYIVQLSKQNDALTNDVKELKSEMLELKNQKVR